MNVKERRRFDADVALGHLVVLVAEDDTMLRELLTSVLRTQGYAILTAENGREAITESRAFRGNVALLLTDMDMPHIGGDELCETLMRERPGLHILQMSAAPAASHADRNLSLAFLKKPFEIALLFLTILNVMAATAGTQRALRQTAAPILAPALEPSLAVVERVATPTLESLAMLAGAIDLPDPLI